MSLDDLLSFAVPPSIIVGVLLLNYYEYRLNRIPRIRVSALPEKDAFDIEAEEEVEQFLKRRTP